MAKDRMREVGLVRQSWGGMWGSEVVEDHHCRWADKEVPRLSTPLTEDQAAKSRANHPYLPRLVTRLIDQSSSPCEDRIQERDILGMHGQYPIEAPRLGFLLERENVCGCPSVGMIVVTRKECNSPEAWSDLRAS